MQPTYVLKRNWVYLRAPYYVINAPCIGDRRTYLVGHLLVVVVLTGSCVAIGCVRCFELAVSVL